MVLMINYTVGFWYITVIYLFLQVPINVENSEEVHSAVPSYWSIRPPRHQPRSHSHLLVLPRHPLFRR